MQRPPRKRHGAAKNNVIAIPQRGGRRLFASWRVVVTLVLIFAVALGSALTFANIASVESQIVRARNDRMRYQQATMALRDQASERYTREEIERIARERLGMTWPDPSQIIEIYVPRQSYVVLNTDEDVLPGQNYFWQGIVSFITGR